MAYSFLDAARVSAWHTREHMSFAMRERRQPGSVVLDGVEISLGPWATPPIRAAMYWHTYEQAEREVLRATLTATDRFLEVGCGVGLIAVLAARTARAVIAVDANPDMVEVARRTLAENGATAELHNAVLMNDATTDTAPFYRSEDFWVSSLHPVAGALPVDVPVKDARRLIEESESSYLMVDIEGGETRLLADGIPECVRAICVETHSEVTGKAAQSAMLRALLEDGFVLDIDQCRGCVLFLARP